MNQTIKELLMVNFDLIHKFLGHDTTLCFGHLEPKIKLGQENKSFLDMVLKVYESTVKLIQ